MCDDELMKLAGDGQAAAAADEFTAGGRRSGLFGLRLDPINLLDIEQDWNGDFAELKDESRGDGLREINFEEVNACAAQAGAGAGAGAMLGHARECRGLRAEW